MKRDQSRNYDKEFKRNAVKLYHASGKSCGELSSELGVPESTLAGWVYSQRKEGMEVFSGKGCLKKSDAETSQLRKELAIAREERDILKKALAIFSVPRK